MWLSQFCKLFQNLVSLLWFTSLYRLVTHQPLFFVQSTNCLFLMLCEFGWIALSAVSKGMLPNRFPDDGSEPTESEYDNADGTVSIRFTFTLTAFI